MNPVETVKEAAERHEAAGQPRWLPIVAAALAVLAAIGTYLSSVRSTGALFAKNEAAVAATKAADSWNEYEARSIKQHIYLAAAADATAAKITGRLDATAAHERMGEKPAQERAKQFERQIEIDDARSERLMKAHEVLEIGTTLFEIAIVLISITALLRSLLLRIAALVAAGAGVIVLAAGLFV